MPRYLLIGAALLVGVVLGALTCTTATPLPPLLAGGGGFCTYPRGCYLVQKDGPLSGQCGECDRKLEHCRLIFVATPGVPDPLDLGGVFFPPGYDLAGADLIGQPFPDPASAQPQPIDRPISCAAYNMVPAGLETICATPESLCLARGPSCTTSCVPAGDSCATSSPITPQRRPGASGTDTYCTFTDDICCPATTSPDGGSDAGPDDAGTPSDAQPG